MERLAQAKHDHHVARRTVSGPDVASRNITQDVQPDVFLFRRSACACGGGCPACQSQSNSLKISQPSDAAEIEADQIADRVMRMPIDKTPPSTAVSDPSPKSASTIQRKCDACEKEEEEPTPQIQRKQMAFAGSEPPPSNMPPAVTAVLNSLGHPLDLQTRNFFEPRFRMDLSGVRIHTDSTAGISARAIDARAYTFGNNIVFGSGEYSPRTESGRHLIAHELAHVGQQSFGGISRYRIQRKPNPWAAKIRLLTRDEAMAIIGTEVQGRLDETIAAMGVITKTLDMPFTNENAELRVNRLVAAISILDGSGAELVYRALTKPADEKQKHVKDRFDKLSGTVRHPLLDLLKSRTPATPSKVDSAPQETTPQYQEGKATWVEVHSGVFAYAPDSGMTLKKVARYISGHPDMPAGLSKLNNDIPVDQALEAGRPVIVPVEFIDQDRAWGEMSQAMAKRISDVRRAKFNAKQAERMMQVKPGRLGPGMVGPFPMTGAMASAAADALAVVIEGILKIIKGFGYGIAFAGGIVHGFLASIWDTVSGIAKMIYDIVDSIISGDLIDDIKKLIDGMKQLTWDKVSDMVGDWALEWHKKLNSDSVWVAGHAHGYLTGYVMAEAAMLLLSGGTTAGLKGAFWASRVGKFVKGSRAFIAAEQKIAQLAEAGGEIAKVMDKVRDSKIGTAVKVAEKTLEVAGWTIEKAGKVLSLPGDIAVYVVEKAVQHAKKLGPFFERIGKLTKAAKKWLFGCFSPCVWDPDVLAKLMTRFVDEEIEVLCKATNRADLMKGKWFDKTLKVGDDLPDGYHWRGDDIVRGRGKRKAEYAPLSYDKQTKKINVGGAGERISNPSTMKANYKEQVRKRIKEENKGKNLSDKQIDAKVAKEMGEHAVHHLIPDNLVQDHPLGKAARKAGYDLDQATNLQGLRKTEGLTNVDAGDIGHWSSHPKYDALVEGELTRVQKALEKEFKSLDKVPNDRMLKEMEKIEKKFRKMFEEGKVPIDPETGRLVEVSPAMTEEEAETAIA